jgi:hypothetical protein
MGYRGYRRTIFANYWLPGQPKFRIDCGDREKVGKPQPKRRRRK